MKVSQQMQLLEILSLMELFTDLLLQHLGSNSITEPSPWGLPHNCPFKDMLTRPHFLLTCKIRGTSCDTDFEMPQVQFDRIDDEDVAMCISKGWYLMPNVIWLDPAERDLSNHSTVEVLEEQMNGFHRVLSVLKYPVKLNEKCVCCITETDVNNQPFRIIHKYPKTETARAGIQAGGVGEGEAGLPLSREPNVGLNPRTPGS
ncbi:uncharacterized protein LOC129046581 isoform X2 [Mirounga angustirostris]|uniref:uncharacterized protein LOC129046581 isoform X2 n=1 Tax=Mirounga angustirostris TaxID=9716 RepID=UPI00313DBE6B